MGKNMLIHVNTRLNLQFRKRDMFPLIKYGTYINIYQRVFFIHNIKSELVKDVNNGT